MPALAFETNEALSTETPIAPAVAGVGFVAQVDDQPVEGGFDPAFGNVTWQTLISGERTASSGLVLGVATFPGNGVLHLHRHTPPEFYLGLTGSGVVTMDGVEHHIAPGSAVYIPGDVEHGVVAGPDGMTFAYGFGEDTFSDIEYCFSA